MLSHKRSRRLASNQGSQPISIATPAQTGGHSSPQKIWDIAPPFAKPALRGGGRVDVVQVHPCCWGWVRGCRSKSLTLTNPEVEKWRGSPGRCARARSNGRLLRRLLAIQQDSACLLDCLMMLAFWLRVGPSIESIDSIEWSIDWIDRSIIRVSISNRALKKMSHDVQARFVREKARMTMTMDGRILQP